MEKPGRATSVVVVPALLAVSLILSLSVTAPNIETFGGTIVIVGISADEVVVAADSRIILGRERYDDACKIRALSASVVFAAAGKAGEGPRSRPTWSAFKEAAKALETVRLRKQQQPQLVAAADEWSRAVRAELEQMVDRNPIVLADLESAEVTTGIFAGAGENGRPAYAYAVLKATRTSAGWGLPIRTDVTKDIYHEGPGWDLKPFGDSSFWKEVQEGQTDRAKQTLNQLKSLGVEAASIKIADASVEYNEDGKIGGEVDAAAVKKNVRAHWVRRKSGCPSN